MFEIMNGIFEIAGAIFLALVFLGTVFFLLWLAECAAVRLFPDLARWLPGHLQPGAFGKRHDYTVQNRTVENPR